MIWLVATTIVERPTLTRDKEQLVKHHIRELPNMIRCFRNAIVSVSRESKWCKLALLRNCVPVEIFTLIHPYLITKGAQDFYPSVAWDQWVAPRKYLLLEAKLHRLELVHNESLFCVRQYISCCKEFREESKTENWQLRQLNSYDKKIEFLDYVLMVRYFTRDDSIVETKYDIEHMLRYWF